jgi:hypothetical protein
MNELCVVIGDELRFVHGGHDEPDTTWEEACKNALLPEELCKQLCRPGESE